MSYQITIILAIYNFYAFKRTKTEFEFTQIKTLKE